MNRLDERMAAFRGRFAAAAAGEAEQLTALLEAGDLKGARALAHALAGRAGMFGFDAVGEAALCADEAANDSFPAKARLLIAALRRIDQEL